MAEKGNGPSSARVLSSDAKLRACIRMATTPFGRKGHTVGQLASELGRSRSSLYGWQRRFRLAGMSGLSRNRADKGIPRSYSPAEFDTVIATAERIRRCPSLRISREWRSLKLPGSRETFRRWVRTIQIYGVPGTSIRRLSA